MMWVGVIFRKYGPVLWLLAVVQLRAVSADLSVEDRTVQVSGKRFSVRLVRVPLEGFQIRVGLAQGRVGATEWLAELAQRYQSIAAINGCFFDAYTASPLKPPFHTLITGGEIVHIGNVGTVLGFDGRGRYRMERVKVSIRGTAEQKREWWLRDWYAYFINHPPETANAAVIYTKSWYQPNTPNGGVQVVVRRGVVQKISSGSQPIPDDGFVLLLKGKETSMLKRFRVGQRCTFRITFEGGDGAFWRRAQEAIGCGPMLVKDGRIVVDPTAEGFSHAKVLRLSGIRSAVGITASGELLLVTCSSATIRELARVMEALGAKDAMNLDGGASSGLWANGEYLTKPGRAISNALLVFPRPKRRWFFF
jgi:hypothetical protein